MEVRTVAIELDAKQINPTTRRVAMLVTKPLAIRNKEVRKAIRKLNFRHLSKIEIYWLRTTRDPTNHEIATPVKKRLTSRAVKGNPVRNYGKLML